MADPNWLLTHAFEYVDPINSNLECAICRSPFIEPTLISACQHIFCSSCLSQALECSRSCPIDRQPLEREDLRPAPRAVQALCDELRITCGEEGCSWSGERSGLGSHWASNECAAVVDDLAQEETPEPSDCIHCFAALTTSLPTHLLVCPSVPTPCPYASYGCPARHPRAELQEKHLQRGRCAFAPLAAFLGQFDRMEEENAVLRRRCEALEEGMREMRDVLDGVKKGMGAFFPSERPVEIVAAEGPPPTARRRSSSSSWHSSSPPLPSTSQSTLDHPTQSSAPLSTLLSSHGAKLASLNSSLSALDARHTAARTESTHALRGEVHDLRQGLLGVRAQVMHLCMDQARRDAMRAGWRAGGGMMRMAGGGGSEEGEEGSGSEDESGIAGPVMMGGIMGGLPILGGMGMPMPGPGLMGPRFGAGPFLPPGVGAIKL